MRSNKLIYDSRLEALYISIRAMFQIKVDQRSIVEKYSIAYKVIGTKRE